MATSLKSDDIDLTPMVDVTFLLLIFFVMTAAFSLQKSIEVPPTQEDEPAANQTIDDFAEETIIVRVDADNFFWISSPTWSEEKEAPSSFDMLIKVREAVDESSAQTGAAVNRLLVVASEQATHEKVVAALDAGSAVGMEEVQLATVEDDTL